MQISLFFFHHFKQEERLTKSNRLLCDVNHTYGEFDNG